MISVYSFVTAVIFSSVYVVAISYLRKSNRLVEAYGVNTLVLLFILCIFRLLVPVEFFPAIVIPSTTIFPAFLDAMYATLFGLPVKVYQVLLLIWLSVFAVLSGRLLFQTWNMHRSLRSIASYAVDTYDAWIASFLAGASGKTKKPVVVVADGVAVPMIVGLRHPTILLPNETYAEEELFFILKHECMHYQHKDLWIKFLTQVFCCLFWWNPFVYLLKHNLDHTLEMKCDRAVVQGLDEKEQLLYVQAMLHTMKNVSENNVKCIAYAPASLVVLSEADKARQRFQLLLSGNAGGKPGRSGLNIALHIMTLGIYILSYCFILQPRYDVSDMHPEMLAAENAFIVQQEEGIEIRIP